MIMPHPPGAENDPDDRDAYVQDNGYTEDADGNIIGGEGEGNTVPDGWPSHEAVNMQVRSCEHRSWYNWGNRTLLPFANWRSQNSLCAFMKAQITFQRPLPLWSLLLQLLQFVCAAGCQGKCRAFLL